MSLDRPLRLLRHALECRDFPLAAALARRLGRRADRELRYMPRLQPPATPNERPLLEAALEVLSGNGHQARPDPT